MPAPCNSPSPLPGTLLCRNSTSHGRPSSCLPPQSQGARRSLPLPPTPPPAHLPKCSRLWSQPPGQPREGPMHASATILPTTATSSFGGSVQVPNSPLDIPSSHSPSTSELQAPLGNCRGYTALASERRRVTKSAVGRVTREGS